jgi:hypothetical protein
MRDGRWRDRTTARIEEGQGVALLSTIGNPQNLHLINLKFEKLEDSSEIDESGKI